jgi:hypothetical protein
LWPGRTASATGKGWVLDRSDSGMRLEIPGKVEIGAILQVRNADHARSAPWVQVEVRNCVVKANQWRAGCRFTHNRPKSSSSSVKSTDSSLGIRCIGFFALHQTHSPCKECKECKESLPETKVIG